MKKIELSQIKKILIIQYEPFGDVLLNTGYLPALRKKFPAAKIDFLVRKPYHKVIENNPYLDEVVVFESKTGLRYLLGRASLFLRIFTRKYDMVIDQIRGTGSAQMTLFSGAKYRLGFKKNKLNFVYNIKPKIGKLRYYAGMKFDLLNPLGITEEPYELFFQVKPESMNYIDNWLRENNLADKKIICFSPGSPVPRKQWKLENYATLADLIIKNTDREVVFLWGPGEKDDVDRIAALMKNPPVIALPTDFNQAGAMLRRSELLICNDGGINHLSVAVKTPSLAIFGSTGPTRWGAQELKGHYVLHNEKVNSRIDKTFGITPEQAFEKTLEILKEL